MGTEQVTTGKTKRVSSRKGKGKEEAVAFRVSFGLPRISHGL